MEKKIEAVFLDRDGTIGGTGHFIHPDHFEPYPFFYEAIDLLKRENIKIFSFTNQHRISRGEVKVADFEREFLSYGFDKAYICPHAMGSPCACQKPKAGMLLTAAEEFGLDLRKCVVIGDVGSDMLAASEVGATKILVKTGWGMGSLGEFRHLWAEVNPDYVAEDLLEGVKWLISEV